MRYNYQRWMLKTSLVYLLVGIILGLFMFLGYRYPAFAWATSWRTVHVHLILFGAVIQIIMGVALWMFPRKKEPPHYTTEREGMILYGLFNAGTLLRSVAEPFWAGGSLPYTLALIGMTLQILSLLYFFYLIFGRIRPPSAVSPS